MFFEEIMSTVCIHNIPTFKLKQTKLSVFDLFLGIDTNK